MITWNKVDLKLLASMSHEEKINTLKLLTQVNTSSSWKSNN